MKLKNMIWAFMAVISMSFFCNMICADTNSFGIAVSAESSSWQNVYSDFLKNEAKTDERGVKGFSVYDLDNNGVPELIYSSNDDKFSDTKIYTYSRGKMIRLTIEGLDKDNTEFWSNYGYIGFSPETGEIVNYSTGTGVSYVYFKLINNKLVYQFETSYGGRPMNVPPGTWDDEDVSEDVYFSRLWKRYPKGMITLGRDFSLTDAEIKCAVYGYGNYKKTYKAFLTQLKKRVDKMNSEYSDIHYNYSFCLKDVTGDSVPELVVKSLVQYPDFAYPNFWIYTIMDNRLVCAAKGEVSVFYTDNGELCKIKDFLIGYDKSSKQIVVKTSFENGKMTEYQFFGTGGKYRIFRKYYLRYEKYQTESRYWYGLSNAAHYWEGVESQKMYNKISEAYQKVRFVSIGNGYVLNSKNIKSL